MNYCKRCNEKINGKFCSECGLRFDLVKINRHYLVSEIMSVLNFEKGIFYTLKELILRPGISIRRFLSKDRSRIIKPVIFILVCSLVFTLAQNYFQFKITLGTLGTLNEDGEPKINSAYDWMDKNYGYASIFLSFFVAKWIMILFKNHEYNYFEILILVFYIIGVTTIVHSVFGIIQSMTDLKIMLIGGFLGLAYSTWAIGKFFQFRKTSSYIIGLIAYFLGFISFTLIMNLIGILIDCLNK